jgi:hypothetical protein
VVRFNHSDAAEWAPSPAAGKRVIAELGLGPEPLVRELGIAVLKEREGTIAAAELMAVIRQSWNRDQD